MTAIIQILLLYIESDNVWLKVGYMVEIVIDKAVSLCFPSSTQINCFL